jgi:hypothetical protein
LDALEQHSIRVGSNYGHAAADLDEKRLSHSGLQPIERQLVVPMATIRAKLDRIRVIEIVDVEFQQVSQQRVRIGRCALKGNRGHVTQT